MESSGTGKLLHCLCSTALVNMQRQPTDEISTDNRDWPQRTTGATRTRSPAWLPPPHRRRTGAAPAAPVVPVPADTPRSPSNDSHLTVPPDDVNEGSPESTHPIPNSSGPPSPQQPVEERILQQVELPDAQTAPYPMQVCLLGSLSTH